MNELAKPKPAMDMIEIQQLKNLEKELLIMKEIIINIQLNLNNLNCITESIQNELNILKQWRKSHINNPENPHRFQIGK